MVSSILLLNKPTGIRSASCVHLLRTKFPKRVKVGHGGTLDSTASGLLVILLGNATRLSDYVMMLPKEYKVTLKLGVSTSTLDYSGEIVSQSFFSHITSEKIDAILPAFQGMRMQLPPTVSAIKIQGKRASDLKRGGCPPILAPRPVTVSFIRRISNISKEGEISLFVRCHKGTYIRSIVRDLGEKLGCGATVTELIRLSTGTMKLESALSYQEAEQYNWEEVLNKTLSLQDFAAHFTIYEANTIQEENIKNGLKIRIKEMLPISRGPVPTNIAICVLGKKLFSLGTLELIETNTFFRPRTNIF